MSSLVPYFVAIFIFLTTTEQSNKSLKEIERILNNLSLQALPKNRLKNFEYYPGQERRYRYGKKHNFVNAQPPEFFYHLNNKRIQKQLEEDLQEALRFESDRICQTTGRCGCSGGRCGKPQGSINRTVDDIEKLLKELNTDLNKGQQVNAKIYNKNKKSNDNTEKYGEQFREHNNQRQRYERQLLNHENQKQKNYDRRQKQNGLRKVHDDIKQAYRNLWRVHAKNRQYRDKRQQNDHSQHTYDYIIQKYYDERQKQDEKRQEYDKNHQHVDKGQIFDNGLQLLRPDVKPEYYETKEEQEVRKQDYEHKEQKYENRWQLENNEDNYDVDQNVQIRKADKDTDFNIIILEIPESNKFQNRDDDAKIIDINELDIKDALQQQKNHDKIEGHTGSLDNDLLTLKFQKPRQYNRFPRNNFLKHAWRRNIQNVPNYGIPFDLQVQGLGQINSF